MIEITQMANRVEMTKIAEMSKIPKITYMGKVQWLAIKLAVSIPTIRKLAVVVSSFQVQKSLKNMDWKS